MQAHCNPEPAMADSRSKIYSVALTSCGRFDLLERTLDSLLPRLEGDIQKIVLIEDSGRKVGGGIIDIIQPFARSLADRDYMPCGNFLGEGIEVIINENPLGLVSSIDRLYSQIDTEWIFHCEDDWEFYGRGFIEKSFTLLLEFDMFSMVNLRDAEAFSQEKFCSRIYDSAGVEYRRMRKDSSVCRGISFNPGLRRKSDYLTVGTYADFGVTANEWKLGGLYSSLGYEQVFLCEHAMRHIGGGAHIQDPTRYRKRFWPKLRHSASKRLEKMCWKALPNSDPFFRSRRRLAHRMIETINVSCKNE